MLAARFNPTSWSAPSACVGRDGEGDLVGAVEDAIADGIRDGGVGEEVVPPLVFELTGDDRGTKAVAVFEDLEEVVDCSACARPSS